MEKKKAIPPKKAVPPAKGKAAPPVKGKGGASAKQIVGMPATPDPSTTSAALSVEGNQF